MKFIQERVSADAPASAETPCQLFLGAAAFSGNPMQDYFGSHVLTIVAPERGGVPADTMPYLDLAGGVDDDWLAGESGHDSLADGAGDDQLSGDRTSPSVDADGIVAGGQDELSGASGDDVIEDGFNDGWLTGGPGANTYFPAPGNARDTILGFDVAKDKIDFAAFAGITEVDDLVIAQQQDGLVIDLSAQGGGEIILQDLNMEDLADVHFLFFTDADPVAPA
ncbi:MAG: hypothetical protein OXE97_07220 [Gammaproteobacteria bacterium]|nr:hypothetical protein [Gammaproteobacteria bacterium]